VFLGTKIGTIKLVQSCTNGTKLVQWYKIGTMVQNWYNGTNLVQWYKIGTMVQSWYNGTMLYQWYKTGTILVQRTYLVERFRRHALVFLGTKVVLND
jgi:hypothetical protein